MSLLKKMLLFAVFAGALWLWWSVERDVINETEERSSEVSVAEIPALEAIVSDLEVVELEVPEVELNVGTEVEKFFYNQLDEEQRVIYRELRDGITRGDEEIQLETEDIHEVHDIFRLILFDHPEFFWVTGSGSSTVYGWSDGRTYTVFKPEYGHVGAERERMQAEIEEVVEAFLTSIEPGLSEYELVRTVYEHLIRQTTYNLNAPDHQNIYSVFVNQESVCAGISRAAQLLLNRLGIFATYVVGEAYVPGTSTAPIPHAWNLVRVNGAYYYLDVTWGMPTFEEDSGFAGRIDVIYDYLLLTGEMIYRTHTLREGIVMPEVNSLTHTFFYLNNMFYDSNDRDLLLEAMNTSILNSEDRIAFQFATSELFEEMREVILEELAPIAAQNLMDWHGLTSTQYFFRERENLNKITIYWTYE